METIIQLRNLISEKAKEASRRLLENFTSGCDTVAEDFDRFVAENFAMKRSPGCFNGEGADMALEQTINQSQKKSFRYHRKHYEEAVRGDGK